ncbi:MAG: ArsA-related P-loop ATPase [Bdellovibrionota bacterium]
MSIDIVTPMKIDAQLVLVLGSGGVGKTSSSAAIGLALAERGLRTAVITIDPAKRLAQALGLETLSNDPQRVFTQGTGYLDALWLDSRSAFTDLVKRYIKNETFVARVLNNRLFNIIQEQLGGIEEYLSIERLLRLGASGDYDVCVLDTPPSRHALDFIESPRHLLKFFDDSILKIFLQDEEPAQKGGFFSKVFRSTKGQALEIFKKFLGSRFMGELSSLLAESRPVHQALRDTAHGAEAWVRRDDTRVLLVTLPERYPIEEAHLLGKEVLAHGMHKADLLVLNRCLPSELPADLKPLTAALGNHAADALLKQHHAQDENVRALSSKIQDYACNWVRVPRYSSSQLDLAALTTIGKDILRQWEQTGQTPFSKN